MKITTIFSIPALMLLVSCGSDNDSFLDSNKDEGEKRYLAGYVGQKESFEWKLLGEVSREQDKVAISPLGVEYVLAMAANGADKLTAGEIISTIFSEEVDIEEINRYYGYLVTSLDKLDDKVSLVSRNVVWADEDIPVYDDFISGMYDTFGATFHTSPSNEMVSDVNEWCRVSTNGTISEILEQAYPLVILNASSLKGGWTLPFDKASTKQAIFHGDKTETADFMNTFEMMNFCSNGMYDIVSKNLGDGHFSFNVLLPKEGVGIEQCLKHLELNGLGDKWAKGNVALMMPKFTVRFNKSLNDNLRNMGIHKAFDRFNAFPGVSPVTLQLGDVKQANVISIDESGVDITSSSAAEFMVTSPDKDIKTSLQMTVDRPFIYFIRQNSDNIVLYSGVVKSLN